MFTVRVGPAMKPMGPTSPKPMRAHDNGSLFSVSISAADVADFKAHWPCSGLTGRPVWAQFEKRNGDLVDLRHDPRDADGAALVALIADGQNYAARMLGLPETATRN